MNKILYSVCVVILLSNVIYAQDTLIYDDTTGNYIIRYLRTNPETDERDSLVNVIFVPATKINPFVKASIFLLPDSNLYAYNYEIENGKDSRQNLFSFLLEFGMGVDVEDRSTNRWHGGQHKNAGIPINKYDWFGNQGLKPTWEKGGFVLHSKGIPGIGNAYFQGLAPTPLYKHGIPPYDLNRQIAALRIFPANRVKRSTVVPLLPPSPFIPTSWCDTLLSYTRQSVQLGWLLDINDRKKIENKINLAKRLLVRAENCKSGPKPDTLIDEAWKSLDDDESLLKNEYGSEAVGPMPPAIKPEKDLKELKQYKYEISKSPKKRKLNESQCKDLCEKVYKHLAIRTLQALVREVEILNKLSDKGKKQYLTSEAYALLKYNTE
jgi:hypothetical protein